MIFSLHQMKNKKAPVMVSTRAFGCPIGSILIRYKISYYSDKVNWFLGEI